MLRFKSTYGDGYDVYTDINSIDLILYDKPKQALIEFSNPEKSISIVKRDKTVTNVVKQFIKIKTPSGEYAYINPNNVIINFGERRYDDSWEERCAIYLSNGRSFTLLLEENKTLLDTLI